MFHVLSGKGYLIITLFRKLEILFDWDPDKHPLTRFLTISWDND